MVQRFQCWCLKLAHMRFAPGGYDCTKKAGSSVLREGAGTLGSRIETLCLRG